jgi:mannose-6-phosphate isomerase-like protein (cupin superfamily)
MTATMVGPGYLVRDVATAPQVPCPCGTSMRPLTSADTSVCSLHVTCIKDSVKHYHRNSTEVYYILEGWGRMEVNGDVVNVEPGMVIYIEPLTRHRLTSREGVLTIVFAIPSLKPDDEFFDEPQ